MTEQASAARPTVWVVGAGPAGLIAAETLSRAGASVTVVERMPSVARKFLMAGRGGLNLTHSEPFEPFLARYGNAASRLRSTLEAFRPADLVNWAEGLDQPTFVGSSGRVFPKAMKASPLLRAWLSRLSVQGVEVRTRTRWTGWTNDGALLFQPDEGEPYETRPDATILALGGASWPRLGSDGLWRVAVERAGAPVVAFRPSNMGVRIAWSPLFTDRFAGRPIKSARFSFGGQTVRGEATVTRAGLEGGAVYALSAAIRDALERVGEACLTVDLKPDVTTAGLAERFARGRPGESWSNRLRKAAGLAPVAVGLVREAGRPPAEPTALASRIKALPLLVTGTEGLERAISSAGGLDLSALAPDYSLRGRPDVFAAGEMLDWEAPTGGYLLQASFATGVAAARGALARLGLEEPVARRPTPV